MYMYCVTSHSLAWLSYSTFCAWLIFFAKQCTKGMRLLKKRTLHYILFEHWQPSYNHEPNQELMSAAKLLTKWTLKIFLESRNNKDVFGGACLREVCVRNGVFISFVQAVCWYHPGSSWRPKLVLPLVHQEDEQSQETEEKEAMTHTHTHVPTYTHTFFVQCTLMNNVIIQWHVLCYNSWVDW